MKALAIILLLALPGATFLAYSQFIGNAGFEWRNFLANYAWCSAVLYIFALILIGMRASLRVCLTILGAGNVALIGFCVWMASLLARGYRDTEIAWVLLFPVQASLIAVAAVGCHFAFSGQGRDGHAA